MKLKTDFFDSLIDDFGIWEHTDGHQPNREEGYALDDATRGLILCLLLERPKQAKVLFDYIAQSFQGGKLYGFAHADHRFWGAPASEDALGQIIWVMGLARQRGYRADEARQIFDQAQQMLGRAPKYLRGSAYALLGAVYVDATYADFLADDLRQRFARTRPGWLWPEKHLTYANGIVPYALLRHAYASGSVESSELGLEVLHFIDEACRLNNHLGPVGNRGWYAQHHDIPPVYSQQPIDAAYMAWSMLAAYQLTGDARWQDCAREWIDWFEGNNVTGQKLYDPATNRCFDGIDDPARVSSNSGAESNICYLLTRWASHHQQLF
jgi:hypothetical protein